MSFFEAVVDTQCTSRAGISYFNKMKMTYQLLVSQLDPNRREGEMEDGRGEEGKEETKQGGGSGAGKEGGSETERMKEEGKEGGREAGRRKRGSAPRTKLKSRGCNSSDLKTILN